MKTKKTSTKTAIPPASLDTSDQLWMKRIPTVSDRLDRVRHQLAVMAAATAGLTGLDDHNRTGRADICAGLDALATDTLDELYWLGRLPDAVLDGRAPTDDQADALAREEATR